MNMDTKDKTGAEHEVNLDSLVGSKFLQALKDSTDRLEAVWGNTGSLGAKAQVDRNVEILHTIEPDFKPDASRRPNAPMSLQGSERIQNER